MSNPTTPPPAFVPPGDGGPYGPKVLPEARQWFPVPDPADPGNPYGFLCQAVVSLELTRDLMTINAIIATAKAADDITTQVQAAREFATLCVSDWNVYERGPDGAVAKVPYSPEAFTARIPQAVSLALFESWFNWYTNEATVSAPLRTGSSAGPASAAPASPTPIRGSNRKSRRS